MTAPQYLPQFPGYPPQPANYPQAPQFPGYPPQPVPAPAVQPLAQGTLDDFYNQPASGGSKALTFPVVGTRYVGVVERPITNGDVQQQTSPPAQGSVPQWYKDGRPKLTLRVPLQMQASADFPDGRATWFVKGADRDELARAMAEAGAPEGAPEHGAVIDITFMSEVASGQGMNPRKVKRIAYTRPNGEGPVHTPTALEQPTVAAPAPVVPQAAPPVAAPVATTPQPSAAQLELLAKLTGHAG